MCRGNELDVDEEYDNDGTLAMYESRAQKGDKEQQVKREKARQVSDYRQAPASSALSEYLCMSATGQTCASMVMLSWCLKLSMRLTGLSCSMPRQKGFTAAHRPW